ncbi:glutamine ABC transporter substrate-binding protein [Dellaglioa algida]|uniref:Transporter substrate-binding domain-containing protein n=1 Tax=Dellaglioa carnosa TaxID=2995136 RepID=A0ABT4JMW8_9LACO|nr:transporter substrate-binding domain-containing protein [Dellaglioa carnosa]TWW13475.1 glutamine ABC transporter substrate-binding protein [Dellaglioa algida]MCZ2491445.1 transporter substrate-binding domain-containing protein [Dellaglioa carnosa]MCZ2493367.1 transporter substrate-binding domain-containing protein [Dellaglioa carnosa]MCZ2494522.1 transporter substrate-binding domain-containing protein [Dellaglioa carnosa]MDK1731062.1 transporter substrate-binding domain-containing protein [
MKQFKKISLLFMSLVMVLVIAGCGSKSKSDILTTAKETKTINWGVKADTKLFGLMNIKTGKTQGFDIDVADAVTKKILGKDATANFVQVTSKTRIPLLKNGNIDAIIATMSISKDREKQVDFSNPYFAAGQSILVKKESSIKSVKDVNKDGMIVLGVKGSTSVINMKKYAPKAEVLELDDYAQALTALKSGQGDALTTDNGILYGMVKENPDFAVVGGTFTHEPYGIAIDKGQDKFKNQINKALAEMRADGTYEKLLNKWFGDIPGFSVKEASQQ